MLRAFAAASAAFVATAAAEKGYPASHWEGDVDAMNAAARGRRLSPAAVRAPLTPPLSCGRQCGEI